MTCCVLGSDGCTTESYSAQVEANHEKWAQEGLYGDTLYELREYNAALYSFHALFSHLGRDKGLAHYDRQNDVETLLKNVVNLHKYTLNYLDCMVAEIPVLGPILAPGKSLYAPSSDNQKLMRPS